MSELYEGLNQEQKEAVMHTDGPLLILAGAGSGKTRVLTHRIAYLIDEKKVNPWNIMAITFTNKAAGEMRERVDKIVGFGSESIWVSTFHSSCVRMLRRYIDRIGFDNHFTIYDTDDQRSLMKDVCKKLQVDTKVYRERALLHAISSAKDELISPEEFAKTGDGDFAHKKIAAVYAEYQKLLHKNNALDFDDLLVKTVELFRSCPDVLESYQDRFRYILVDEYQDTNTVQFQFVSLLASKYKNLCVVGDDDQSIYKFRGANITNILGFEKVFPDAKVIKLEQNYRSTQNILNSANEVIHNNKGRKDKKLWTKNGEGDKVRFRQFQSGYEEAEYVAREIAGQVREGKCTYRDCAVLYRTNAQSRTFEEKFMLSNIPYRIVGGVNFYARKEIKDLLAYLKTIENGQDDLAVQRIINIPKRGIGTTSIAKVAAHAAEQDLSFYDALKDADNIPSLGRSAVRLAPFVTMIQKYRSIAPELPVKELLTQLIEETGYVRELELERTEEAEARIENIDELISKAALYDESAEQPDLAGFLEEVALVADIDTVDADTDCVLLMTLHSAKGLEFPCVYLTGMEDGIFPGYMSITSDDRTEIEEERRLCYVGITRAMKELTLTCARQRMIRGETQYNKISRFIREIPMDMLDTEQPLAHKREDGEENIPVKNAYAQMKEAFRTKAFEPKQFKVSKADHLDYAVGDRVKHIKFGTGEVQDIVEGGKDYEVTVNFDKVGVKKMFAAFAKLKKV